MSYVFFAQWVFPSVIKHGLPKIHLLWMIVPLKHPIVWVFPGEPSHKILMLPIFDPDYAWLHRRWSFVSIPKEGRRFDHGPHNEKSGDDPKKTCLMIVEHIISYPIVIILSPFNNHNLNLLKERQKRRTYSIYPIYISQVVDFTVGK